MSADCLHFWAFIFGTYYFRSNFGNLTCDGFSSTTIICHFEFNGITNLQMFNCSVKLGEMEKQTSLSVTTLNESIRMLKNLNKIPSNRVVSKVVKNLQQIQNTYKQLFNNSSLSMARSRRMLGIVVAVVASSIAVIVGANVEGSNFEIANAWKTSRAS